MPALLAGAANFVVTEDPAYEPVGDGEHLYLELEKEGVTTDAVAEALAKACGKRPSDVGYAGRKDRHAIARQWFSVHFGDEARLANLAEHLRHGRVAVLRTSRHRNKIRLGHLAGNRFRLRLGGTSDWEPVRGALARLAHEGIRNRFGIQRFGRNQATLRCARTWGAGDWRAAVAAIIDADDRWRFGDPLPEGFRPGPEGRVLGFLRKKPDDARGALVATGDQMRKLVASAAQSAVFNAIADARDALQLTHRLRLGDLGLNAKGAPFLVEADRLDDTNLRAAPGSLQAFASAPLPGTSTLRPAPAIDAEERAWAQATGIDWGWLDNDGLLESPGERRALVVPFRAPPALIAEGDQAWLELSLPPGTYATEVLDQCDVTVPDDRRG